MLVKCKNEKRLRTSDLRFFVLESVVDTQLLRGNIRVLVLILFLCSDVRAN